MAEVAPWETAETAPWETSPEVSEGDVFSEGGAQAAGHDPNAINPIVGGAEALAHGITANTIGLVGPAVGAAREWAGRLTTESPEEAAKRGQEWRSAIDPYTVYEPQTKSGKAVTEGAGKAIMAPFETAANAIESPLNENQRQLVEDVSGNFNRSVAPLLPLAGATPEGLGAVRGRAYDAGARSAAIDDARAAATAPPPPPSAGAAGPNPADYAPRPPKPRITPLAGESAQTAAERQGLVPTTPRTPAARAAAIRGNERMYTPETNPGAAGPLGGTTTGGFQTDAIAASSPQEKPPSAAPSAKGDVAPDHHDPAFFSSPDNQDLKSAPAGPAEQASRQAAVERGAPTLPQVRDSAVTNSYADQGRDWTAKQANDPTATAQIAAEGQALHSEAGRISSETGGQQGTGESADTVRGKAYQDWHDSTVAALDKHIKAAYAAEDAAAKGISSPGSNLKGVLADDSLIDSQHSTAARNSTKALARNMGVDLDDPHAQISAYQLEQLRKHANNIYGNSPRFAQAVKNAVDADLPSGAYVNARKLQQTKSDMFDNRAGINKLGPEKSANENRQVAAGDVMKTIESMTPDQVQHIHNTMKRSASVLEALGDHDTAVSIGNKAHKAAQQLQSHFTEQWIKEAGTGGGWNTRRAHQFLRNNQETLNAVLNPEQMHQIRNVSEAANVLDLDKRYKGAFAQFATGAGWLRRRAVSGALSAVDIGLAKATGGASLAAEHGLDVLTGGAIERMRNAAIQGAKTAPENFTRPLGATIGGGKQRGAIGVLNKNHPVTHEYEPGTGEHTFRSANGHTQGFDHSDGNGITLKDSRTAPGAQGSGEGVARMVSAADLAHSRDGLLHSDVSVSPSQAKAYGTLSRLGYDVKRNPRAAISESTGNWVSHDPREPVFTVGPRNETMSGEFGSGGPGQYSRPSKTPVGLLSAPSKPLGQTLFGGKQRGGPGPGQYQRGSARVMNESKVSGDDVVEHIRRTQPPGWNISTKDARDLAGLDSGGDYKLVDYPVSKLKLLRDQPWNKQPIDATAAEQYAARKTPFPAITLDGDGGIRDGNTRIEAAAQRGDRTMKAYVPIDSTTGDIPPELNPHGKEVALGQTLFGGKQRGGPKFIDEVGVKREEKQLQKFHGSLMGSVRERAEQKAAEVERLNHKYDVGDRVQGDKGVYTVVAKDSTRRTPEDLANFKSTGKTIGDRAIAGREPTPAYVMRGADGSTFTMPEWGIKHGFSGPQPFGQTLFGGKQRGGPKFERQTETTKAGGGEAPAMVNVGLHVGDPANGGRVMDPKEALAGIRAAGGNVTRHSVVQSDTEPTLVADLAKPFDKKTLGNLSGRLQQGAIAQRHADGTGLLAGPQAKDWGGKYNPDFFRMHNGQTATESHPVLSNLTDEERGQLRSHTTQRLMDAFHGAPATEEYAAAALAGSAKRGWYANSAKAIGNVFGPDAPRFSGLLSALSPQTSVEANFHNALHTFVNWDKAGRPTDPAAIRQIMTDSVQKQPGGKGILPAWENNSIRALTADDPGNIKLSGPKVHSFYSNLTDKVNEVTNDAWMATFAKLGNVRKLGGALNQSGPGKSSTYLAFSAKVRAAAKQISAMTGEAWTPREVQETVWSWAKTAFEHAEEHGEKTIPELVKHGHITDELIRSTPDFHQLFSSPEHRGFLQSSRYAANAERLAGAAGETAVPAHTSKARAAAAKTLRPHLLAAAERLEQVRQERTASQTEKAPF